MSDQDPQANPPPDAPPAPRRRSSCLSCLTVLALFLALGSWPMFRPVLVSLRIHPGMSVEEVFERAQPWSLAQAWAGPSGKRVASFWVGSTAYGVTGSDERRAFDSPAAMARGLAAEMQAHHVDWTLSLGYVSGLPRRQYVTILFGPDGRVKKSGPGVGSLD